MTEQKERMIPVLDHGFIRLVDVMGSDQAIVDAARVSYGEGTRKANTDRNLIRYLVKHAHTSPLEMVEFKFHIKAPVFVFRQWQRHRTANINEMSGRYSIMPDQFYLPDREHTAVQSSDNKQGRGEVLTEEQHLAVIAAIEQAADTSFQTYNYLLGVTPTPPDQINLRVQWAKEAALAGIRKARAEGFKTEWSDEDIDEKIREYFAANELAVLEEGFAGLARELARIVLPLSVYSEMYWKCDLHNILHFINLRLHPHAQYEIRVYAQAMLDLVREVTPWAVEAHEDYIRLGTRLSRFELEGLRAYAQDHPDLVGFVRDRMKLAGCSDRELQEWKNQFDAPVR